MLLIRSILNLAIILFTIIDFTSFMIQYILNLVQKVNIFHLVGMTFKLSLNRNNIQFIS